ncbi:MAG: ATP-binding protein [Thermodesulfovibrionales bacterium]|nr:ATP-binding protein [Thermodesulfovibrionales bacterium]
METHGLIVLLLVCFGVLILLILHMNKRQTLLLTLIDFMKDYKRGNMGSLLLMKDEKLIGELAMSIARVLEKIEQQLFDAEEKTRMLEATIRGMSDGLLVTDTRGKIILANQPFKRLLGISSSIEGKEIIEVIRDRSLVEIFRRATDTWEILTEEVAITINDNSLYLLVTAVPMYAPTSITGIVFTIQNITRLKRLEEVRKDFVANVSHEIKTPLTAIRASAETLIDSALQDQELSLKFLNMIKSHSERLNTLVDDLLVLSRIELGDMPIEKSRFNIEEAIDTVIITLKEKAESKGLIIKKDLPQETIIINGDKDKVIQILLNLVDNSIKFTEKGFVTIGAMYKTNGSFLFYVQDTGIGIPKSHIERLGERFYRVDRARSRELGGTGLGLAIVKHLVSAHCWQMSIESELAKGTIVRVFEK